MHTSVTDAIEFSSYHLKDRLFLGMSSGNHKREDASLSWDDFFNAFIDQFMLLDLTYAKTDKFATLRQDTMSARYYSLMFTQISRYGLELVSSCKPGKDTSIC